MWIVTLTKEVPLVNNDFRADFFPRKYRFKFDALKLVKEVRAKGGDAKMEKEVKNGPKRES